MIVASSGMVYVWSNAEPEKSVLKLDMGSGDWTWKKLPVLHPFNDSAVASNGKIYVPGLSVGGSGNPEEKDMVLVYDIIADRCEAVKAWNRDYLGVLRKEKNPRASLTHSSSEELYSFVEHDADGKLEILMYDAGKDAWRREDMIPIPDCQWSEVRDIKLMKAHCFDPAPEEGINTVWVDREGEVISWFNPHQEEPWLEFDYHAIIEGKALEYMQFPGGSLYGMFIEDKDDQDDEEEERSGHGDEDGGRGGRQDPDLFKRTLMRGTMSVAGNIVNWEEVLDVGCFREAYNLQPSVVQPIEHYTIMA